MILEAIYNHSPIWMQNIMCSVKGWVIYRRRYGKGFFRELKLLTEHKIDSEKELRDFLSMAKDVPAYSHVFSTGKGRMLADFPIIDKKYVKAHYEDFINKMYLGPKLFVHTSGTTGTSLEVPQSQSFERRQWATWWRYREALGIKFGTWYGWFGCGEMIVPISQNKPPFWRVELAGHRIMFGTYHLNISNVHLYVDEIKRRNLIWLHGNASRICYFSKLILESGVGALDCVKFVTTASENLSAADVRNIAKVFPKAIIRNHYGMTEGVANFSQTLKGEWRIDDDFAYVELIPIDKDHPRRCRIIGTNFSNPAFPLIRYDMGDIAIVEWENEKARILGIEGRVNECITLDNGMLINSMLSYDIFGDVSHVREAQIRVIDGDKIELLVVKALQYTEKDEEQIYQTARKYLKNDVKITIRYTDSIPRTKSGKFSSVVKVSLPTCSKVLR